MRKPLFVFPVLFSFHLFSQNPGDGFFLSSDIHDIQVSFQESSFWDSLTYYHDLSDQLDSNIYMRATLSIDGTIINDTGIRLKGNSSYKTYPGVKKSMKVSFDEFTDSQTFDGLKQLNLNNCFKDPTHLREKVFLDFLKDQGISAPRCTFAKVYLNGAYWGLYSVVEEVDKTFLFYRFGNKGENLYKGDPQGKLTWKGSDQALYYNDYELKTNEDVNDWSDLVHLISVINNSGTAFQDSLEFVLDSDAYIAAWVANNLFVNLDSYMGSGHNYFIYYNSATGKFNWIPWDVNEAFGNFSMGMSLTEIESLSLLSIPQPTSGRPLNRNMLQDSEYKKTYLDLAYSYLENDFSPWNLNPQIDSLADRIRTDVYADTNKMYSNQQFEDNMDNPVTGGMGQIPGLKSFIENRRQYLNDELVSLGYPALGSPYETKDLDAWKIYLYPNPSKGTVLLRSRGERIQDLKIDIYDIMGRNVLSRNIDFSGMAGGESFSLNLDHLGEGVYYCRMTAPPLAGLEKIVIIR